MLPADDVGQFVNEVIMEAYDQLEAEIERHVLDADVRPALEADSSFQRETVTTIPAGLHPEFGGTQGELWQKPASKVPHLDGSQGFLQVWVPDDADDLALVRVTDGDYHPETVIEETRSRLRETVEETAKRAG